MTGIRHWVEAFFPPACVNGRIRLLHCAFSRGGGTPCRELIGQAEGILIERERITADQVFHVLRQASQHLNVRL
jgi:hypothetical protein